MTKVSKLQAECFRLNGFKVVRTKNNYYLLNCKGKVNTGYSEYY